MTLEAKSSEVTDLKWHEYSPGIYRLITDWIENPASCDSRTMDLLKTIEELKLDKHRPEDYLLAYRHDQPDLTKIVINDRDKQLMANLRLRINRVKGFDKIPCNVWLGPTIRLVGADDKVDLGLSYKNIGEDKLDKWFGSLALPVDSRPSPYFYRSDHTYFYRVKLDKPVKVYSKDDWDAARQAGAVFIDTRSGGVLRVYHHGISNIDQVIAGKATSLGLWFPATWDALTIQAMADDVTGCVPASYDDDTITQWIAKAVIRLAGIIVSNGIHI